MSRGSLYHTLIWIEKVATSDELDGIMKKVIYHLVQDYLTERKRDILLLSLYLSSLLSYKTIEWTSGYAPYI